jgi:EAL domain-containing protein (putative c-di-GMP-specific phosphodiesterase class I)/ActR/RegA family two-component response regulator
MTTPATKPKVLLVDDEPRILAGLRRQLHRGFQVVTAGSGSEALKTLAAEDDFAVVVSDMRMPGMDGATFLARVRLESPRSTRILLTGQTELSAAVRAINDGQIFRFLSKPCPPEVLDKCLQEAVSRYRATLDEVRLSPGSVGNRRLMELNDRCEVVAVGNQTGLENRQFRLQYQPIIRLASTAAIGVEAILRWLDPEGAIIEQPAWEPTGDARGLHMPLGRWMTAAACQEVASWPATGAEPLQVHVKMFSGQLRDPRLIEDLAHTLIMSGLEPQRLTLEVPQANTSDPSVPLTNLETISRWGVQLALVVDGAGPALSESGERLRFNAVKVSVRRAAHDLDNAEALRIVETAAEIGRRQAAPTIANDVDCTNCLQTARDSGCESAQGAYYALPADPGDLLPGLVANRK